MSGADAAPAAPRGWYPHPDMGGTERYWNGTAWTGEVRPWAPPPSMPTQAAPAERKQASMTLVWIGYALATLGPVLMFTMLGIFGVLAPLGVGVALVAMRRPRHGLGVVALTAAVVVLIEFIMYG